jgi:hypothetical protein
MRHDDTDYFTDDFEYPNNKVDSQYLQTRSKFCPGVNLYLVKCLEFFYHFDDFIVKVADNRDNSLCTYKILHE